MPLRRKLIVGAAPLVVTLVSRPALAQVCTVSALASVNLSADTPTAAGVNCGVSPSCWHGRAARDTGAWVGSTYSETQSFAGVFTGAGVTAAGTIGWHIGNGTLDDALSGNVSVVYQRVARGRSFVPTNAATFVAETVAALLNASAFNSAGHFPLSVTNVLNAIRSIWLTTPNDRPQLDTSINAAIQSFQSARAGGTNCDV